MMSAGELERVRPDEAHVAALLTTARAHLASAELLRETDPAGAYGLMYDAARKSMTAILANQGLRATTRGGHIAVYQAVSAQLDPPLGKIVRPFNRMRARRNDVEYPSPERPAVTPDEVAEDLEKAAAIVEMAEKAIPGMGVY
ncbi:HEPN domain-containing protein [Jiangella mangrovi]|uniref:HEPN domain-containing protein n=1 Tax=Jiangella mangrovi TaxID=1524084 RepID=A0A7W9GU56_9ACTN|nr:HEPN domain-containing protein [Jiangella mangrovi]MBB5790085.1 hypothetical protein [Jiangella mangrovi]